MWEGSSRKRGRAAAAFASSGYSSFFNAVHGARRPLAKDLLCERRPSWRCLSMSRVDLWGGPGTASGGSTTVAALEACDCRSDLCARAAEREVVRAAEERGGRKTGGGRRPVGGTERPAIPFLDAAHAPGGSTGLLSLGMTFTPSRSPRPSRSDEGAECDPLISLPSPAPDGSR